MKNIRFSCVLCVGGLLVLLSDRPSSAEIAKITAVQLIPTKMGLNLLLQTGNEKQVQVSTSNQGNYFVAELTNVIDISKIYQTFTYKEFHPKIYI